MLHTKKNFLKSALAVFCMVSMLLFSSYNGITTVYAASGYEYVLLTKYSKTMKIGDEYYLTAITSEHLWKDHGEKGRYCYDHCKNCQWGGKLQGYS